jgi:hypothetical protein
MMCLACREVVFGQACPRVRLCGQAGLTGFTGWDLLLIND